MSGHEPALLSTQPWTTSFVRTYDYPTPAAPYSPGRAGWGTLGCAAAPEISSGVTTEGMSLDLALATPPGAPTPKSVVVHLSDSRY